MNWADLSSDSRKLFSALERIYEDNPIEINLQDDSVPAFLLHQACEKLYNTILLVFYGYKPKTHNLDKLRQYTKQLSEELFSIFPFPIADNFETHLFDLLKRGYLDARYKDDYVITADEFKVLLDRVKKMKEIVQKISIERINSF